MDADSPVFPRFIAPRVAEALADTRVVLLAGPRQSGKTTLAKQFETEGIRYLSLDTPAVLDAARGDPLGFVRGLDRAIIDEVQRAPCLLLAIKQAVDADRRPGRFLLTGSANLMALPTVADSLAGRMETLHLLPLGQCEVRDGTGRWLEAIFAGAPPAPVRPAVGAELERIVLGGGYPEAIARETPRRRAVWARQYIDALIQRDVREIADIHKLDVLSRLLDALAQAAGQACNFAQLGGQLGLDQKTAARYLAIFEHLYLLRRIPVWSGNHLSRLVKTARFQFIDSGLLAALSGASTETLVRDRSRFGRLLESFVFGELLKLISWSDESWRISYYRDHDQYEVDFVVENAAGDIVGIEVKAGATVRDGDLRGLRKLAVLAGRRFVAGIVLYDGEQVLPMGEKLWLSPLSALWL
ncbi:MAG: ATP-binding protein [Sulfuritalea sp.]|nr:ATP-binding protein [Sulfuritalea sp.]